MPDHSDVAPVATDGAVIDPIERVAMAIKQTFEGQGFADENTPGRTERDQYREMAVAAIKALRDPTPEMEAAGEGLDDWGVPSDPGSGNASALAHWTAMIDAALALEGPMTVRQIPRATRSHDDGYLR